MSAQTDNPESPIGSSSEGDYTYELLIHVPNGWTEKQARSFADRIASELAPGCFMFLSRFDGEELTKIDGWECEE